MPNSSAVPKRPAGWALAPAAYSSSKLRPAFSARVRVVPRRRSVSNGPGSSPLIVTPWRMVVRATPATKPVRPERAPLLRPRMSIGAFTELEVMFTMRPKPRFIMPSTVALMNSIGVSMLASIALIQASRFQSRKLPGGGPPALLTTMSGSGHAASTCLRPSSVVTSTATAVTFTPCFLRISSAVASSSDLVRALMTRSTPSPASAIAQPLPRPLLAAQTIALRPLMPMSILRCSLLADSCPNLGFAEQRRADVTAQPELAVRLQAHVGGVDLAVLAVVDLAALEAVGIRGLRETPDQRHADHLAAAQRRVLVAIVVRHFRRHDLPVRSLGVDQPDDEAAHRAILGIGAGPDLDLRHARGREPRAHHARLLRRCGRREQDNPSQCKKRSHDVPPENSASTSAASRRSISRRSLSARRSSAATIRRAASPERSIRATRYCTTPGPACNCRSPSCFRMIEPSSSSSGGATAMAGAARSLDARSGSAICQRAGGVSATRSKWPRRSRSRL